MRVLRSLVYLHVDTPFQRAACPALRSNLEPPLAKGAPFAGAHRWWLAEVYGWMLLRKPELCDRLSSMQKKKSVGKFDVKTVMKMHLRKFTVIIAMQLSANLVMS